MTPPNTPIQPDELMALVDGVLDADRARQIEQRAQYDADLATTIAALRAQCHALRESLDPVLEEPIPARLLQVRGPSFLLRSIAAAFVWISAGVILGSLLSWQFWSREDSANPAMAQRGHASDLPRFVHQAAVAYAVYAPEVRHPVEVSSTDAKTLNTWLSKRLQRSMQAPDLSRLGFALIGGRLLPAELNKPAAQFMYEDRQGHRITMYLRGMAESTPETTFRFADQAGVNTFYWVEGDWGYALSGELPRAQLLHLAHAIHASLSERDYHTFSAAFIPL